MSDTNAQPAARWGKVPSWWLSHTELGPDGVAVMTALASFADAAGECDPSQGTLADLLSRSRPWVNAQIARLEQAGLLSREQRRRGNGGLTSCLYRLRMTYQPDNPPLSGAPNGGASACQPCDRGCQGADTSQTTSKHTRLRRATPPESMKAEIPAATWRPSEAAWTSARQTYPMADLETHLATFLQKCAARSYRYRPNALDITWRTWLDEDMAAKAARPSSGADPRGGSPRGTQRGGRPPADGRFTQMQAWMAACGVTQEPMATHEEDAP